MEKEQKKLLLVAVSVGVFLLVTITVALIMLTPRTQSQAAAVAQLPVMPGIIQPAGNENSAASVPSITNSQETNIYISGEETDVIAPSDASDGDNLVIQIRRPTTAAVPESTGENLQSTAVASAPATAARTATASQSAAQTAAPRTTAAQRTPAPAKTVNDYWIQTGAFSARIRAEDAKERLAENGLTSIIENREIDGRTWYRVRLGPYTSEREAGYWLALVQSIDGFGESQVRQTTRQQ